MTQSRRSGLRFLLEQDLLHYEKIISGVGAAGGEPKWRRLCGPRMMPVLLVRLAHHFENRRLSFLARFFSFLNYLVFGIEVAAKCKIGPGLFFPHTRGTVIGAYEIGARAVIYQGVTLGAKDLNMSFEKSARPTIGDDVYIGAGAKVLGGIHLGNTIKVGANAVVLKDVPSNSVAIGVPALIRPQQDVIDESAQP